MRIALYQEFGEGCRRLTHELLPDAPGWELIETRHVGADIGSLTDEDADIIRSAEVVIATPLSPLPDAIYDPDGRVRLIQLLSAGYDTVDLDRCRAAGQLLATNGGANAVAVAEHTILLILSVLRRLPVIDRDTRSGRWTAAKTPEWEPHELEGRTVGLVGFGQIGRQVAQRLHPFGVELQYFDVVQAPSEVTESLKVRHVSWTELLETSDIVSLHVPLMESTRGLIGAAELAQMKPDAIVINTARGGVIDEDALVDALQQGRLGGAGLDAFVEEPFPAGQALAALDSVVLTPHFAGPTYESWTKRIRFAYENIARVERNQRPESVVHELGDLPLRPPR
ncbi:MAG: 2-hydroxyacid dehydrogenase [Chloroflexi bacterium]|nr:2-hydroxyacid dehydrogenase [Chloroflexota bacterium]